MTSDIRLPPTASTPGPAPSGRPTDAAALALQLLRPIDAAVLPPGRSAPAEVVRSTAQAGQFEILLRIARGEGLPPADVSVTSRQPLPAGTQLVIEAVNQTRLLAVLAGSTAATAPTVDPALTRLDPARFPPDSQLQARVLSQQPVVQQGVTQYMVVARIVQGAGVGALLNLESAKPVEPGTLLTARAGEQGELRVSAATEQQRQLAVTLGLRDSFQRQASPEALMNVLSQLATPGASQAPAALQPIINQVLAHVATVAQLSSEAGVAQAVKQSGLFLENSLAMLADALKARPAGNAAATPTEAATTTPAATPPLSKILPLLATLATPPGVEPLPGADLKATLMTLLMVVQQQLPPDALKTLALPTGPWLQNAVAKPGLFPLPSRALQALGESTDLGSLLRLTAALLSRIQHQQFQSLGQTQTFTDGSSQTVWQMDLPLREGQQFSHVQVRVQRDDAAPTRKQPEPIPKWEVRLAFNLGPLGALQSIARLYRGRVSSEFWAERSDTLSLLDAEIQQLRDRLLAKGLDVGELSCHRGTPPAPRQAVQQTWVDEVT